MLIQFSTVGCQEVMNNNEICCAFQSLTLTDDTVLEEHNEDPALIQMHLIGDGGEYALPCSCTSICSVLPDVEACQRGGQTDSVL